MIFKQYANLSLILPLIHNYFSFVVERLPWTLPGLLRLFLSKEPLTMTTTAKP